jgi:prophage antirepressor-like protein
MIEEIRTDNNCIVKAFENNPIAILQEDINSKKVYYFKANDIGKVLNLTNIAVSIQNYDEDERVIRKAYDTTHREQDTTFLTSQGVYRLLYNSKKEIAKKFRKWAGSILDDIIFNESIELKKQLEEKETQMKLLQTENTKLKKRKLRNSLKKKHYTLQVTTQIDVS